MAWDDEYRKCSVCDKPLNEGLAQLALHRLEKVTCSMECMKKDIIKRHACCDKAEFLPCVCMYAFRCPIHGDKHTGTHD